MTGVEQRVLQAAQAMMRDGKKPSSRSVHEAVKGEIGYQRVLTILTLLRQRGLLDSVDKETDKDEVL